MTCRVCGRPAQRLYRDACDACNRLRGQAAVEFIHAANAIRLLAAFGARVADPVRRHRARGHKALEQALFRLGKADRECVRLMMWAPMRSTRRPPWFYGDERSNTR